MGKSPHSKTHAGRNLADGGIASHRLSKELERLRASAVLQSLIAKSAHDLICFVDARGIRLFNSASYEPILGDSERLIGTRLYDDVRPDDRRSLHAALQGIVRTGKTARTEYRLMARDGAARTIQSEGRAIVDAGETVSGVVLLERDVTEERAAAARLDAALRRQNALAGFSLFALRQPAPLPVIEQATITVADVLDADLATVLELEAGGKALRIVAQCGGPASRIGLRVGIEGTQSGLALALYSQHAAGMLEAPPPVAIEDMTADSRLAGSYRVRALGMKSSLCVVIPAAEGPYGTLAASWRSPHRFDADHTAFLQAVANVLSAALVRFRTQDALRESEARFRGLAELSADWYWEQDANQRFTFVSEGFFEKSGASRNEVLGKSRWEFPSVTLVRGNWDEHRQMLEAHAPFRNLEFYRTLSNGSRRYWSISGEPVFDAEGCFIGYRGTGRDITERKLAEYDSGIATERIRLATQVAHAYSWIWDLASDTLTYLSSPEDLLGPRPADGRYPPFPEMVHPEDRDAYVARSRQVVADLGEYGREFRIIRTDNEVRWLMGRGKAYREDSGSTYMLGVTIDITERKLAEEALSAQTERLRIGQAIARMITLEWDIPNDRLIWSDSPEWLRGPLPPSGNYSPYKDQVHPEDRGKFLAMRAKAIDSLQGEKFEYRIVRTDGKVLWLQQAQHAVYADAEGKAVRMLVALHDITERKRAQQLLALEYAVTRHIAKTGDSSETVTGAIRIICENERWDGGRYLWVDESAAVLRFGEAWSVPGANIERYLRELRDVVYPPGFGMVGKVLQSQRPLWIANIAEHPWIARLELVRETGMRAALAVPIAVEGKPIGVLAFHSQEARQPDEQLMQTIQVIGEQIGLFMQSAQAQQALRESERRHRELFDFSPVPIYVIDRNTLQIIAANERMASQYGWWREELLGMSMLDLCPPAERAKAEAAARGAIDPDQRLVWRHWRRNGEVFEVEVTVHDIESNGRPARLVSPLDVSKRERTERTLRESAESLRSLSRRLVSVQEDQRRSLARELHDRVGQNLTALAINLEILRSGAGRVAPAEFERRMRESAELTEATGKLIDDVTAELHPPMLDEYGLAAALRWYGEQQAARTGLRVDVRLPERIGSPPRADRDLALFRIVQEAMNNVLRHAHASRVEIVLIEDARGLELSVRDDGRGIDTDSKKHDVLRHGTRGMHERALAIGAQFEIAPAPGGGTIVRVHIAP